MDAPFELEKPHLALWLTGMEIVYLTDAIDNGDLAKGLDDKEAYIPLARKALLLLGSAYREVVTQNGIKEGPIEIRVEQEIAWLLRGKVKTADLAMDNSNVGMGLLLKLYDILIRFNSGLDNLEVVEIDEPPVSEEIRKQLEDFNVRGGTDTSTITDGDTSRGTEPEMEGRPRETLSRTEDADHKDDCADPALTKETADYE